MAIVKIKQSIPYRNIGFAVVQMSPPHYPCPGLCACGLTSCTFGQGACGVSTCSSNAQCLAAATPTPIPQLQPLPLLVLRVTLFALIMYAIHVPQTITVNCSTNPVSCTFTGIAPTPTPTIAPGGDCGLFGCNGPSLNVSWRPNFVLGWNLQLVKGVPDSMLVMG